MTSYRPPFVASFLNTATDSALVRAIDHIEQGK